MSLFQDLHLIRFWPYLFSYFKINYFILFLLAGVLLALLVPRFWRASFNSNYALGGIFVLGVALRVFWVWYSPHQPHMAWGPNGIENDLINLNALDILKGIWFVGADGNPYGRRPLGYPLFLAAIYKIAGPYLWAIWTVHVILFCIGCFFIYRLARFLFSREQALLPALFYSIYPTSVYATKLITDENLFVPVWLGGIYFFILALKKNKLWSLNFFLAAGLSAFATIIRTHAIFMPAVFAIGFLAFQRSWRKAFCAGFIGVVVLLAMNAPWVYRNYKLWKVPVMFSATASYVYAQVNSTALPDEGAGRIPIEGDEGYSSELSQIMREGNEGQVHLACNLEMKKWIVQHPVQFGVIGIRKLLNFMAWNRKAGVWPLWYQWTPGHFDERYAPSKAAVHFFQECAFVSYYIILHTWMVGLILWGLSFRRQNLDSKMLLLMLFCSFAFWFAEHMVIYSDRKYRYPLEPLMILLSCQTWFWIHDKRVLFLSQSKKLILKLRRKPAAFN